MAPRDSSGREFGSARVAGATLHLRTFAASAPLATPEDLKAFYDEVAESVARRGGFVVHEKAFGLLACSQAAADARATVFAARGLPPPVPHSYIEGRPCIGGLFSGVQVWTVDAEPGVRCTQVEAGPGSGATRVDAAGGRMLFLSGVTGRAPGAAAPGGPYRAFMAAFQQADALLRREGFSFANVARTWLFLDRLLQTYEDLNRARSAFLKDVGLLTSDPEAFLPASTGIQGRNPAGTECLLDVLAVAGVPDGKALLLPIRSPRQDSAFLYGSAFARGMQVGTGDAPLLLVSGTASIDRQGLTTCIGDRPGQIVETYRNVAAILQDRGASLGDVALAIRYFKDEACWRAHRDLAERGLLPDLPAIDVLADVCRDDLLFEMEATAC